MSISTHLGFGALVAVSILFAAGSASAAVDLTGCWYGPATETTFYIPRRGATVWWVGMSGDGGVSWTNAYHGPAAKLGEGARFTLVRAANGNLVARTALTQWREYAWSEDVCPTLGQERCSPDDRGHPDSLWPRLLSLR